MVEYREEVDSLIQAYGEYKRLLQDEADISMKLAKQKIVGTVEPRLLGLHKKTKQALQAVSNSMTFSNPFVWIMYKFEAYKDEAQPIRTMRDFRVHCSKNGDICAKRFAFINEQLVSRKLVPLTDTSYYKDDISLDTLLEEQGIQEIAENPAFMALWGSYEYHEIANQPAKWQNY